MNRELKRNICSLVRFSTNDSLVRSVRDECISEELRYSCWYWPDHTLSDSQRDEHLVDMAGRLKVWMEDKLLQWIEVVTLGRGPGHATEALGRVREWLSIVRIN